MGNYQLREAVLDVLLRIDEDSGYSHLLINHEIKSRKLATKDEGLFTEIVYGTLQRKLTLDYYLEAFISKKIEPWVKILLRMSLYQMIYLDKVPDHAILHEAVEIAKRRGHKGIASLVNGVLRNIQRKGLPDTNDIQDPSKRIAVETSHPKWLVKRWLDLYGETITRQMCEANLERKPISIRVQPLKITREDAIKKLEGLGFVAEPSTFSDQGIIVHKGNILRTELFSKGFVTIQDQSSMLVGEMLSVKPRMRVLDACSAPGGKVTHIAEKMEDKGEIHAYDLHAKKTKLIDQKASDLGLTIIDTNQGDARNSHQVYDAETFDRILVDAPCSGLGVIRGKPDIKYSKKEADIERLAHIQQEILESVTPLLKKDGKLIYSTCTVDKHENEKVVKTFLDKHPEFMVDQTFFDELPTVVRNSIGNSEYGLQLFPHTFQTDGFFLTRLIQKGKSDN
ncbi:16S rRNA (cytosine(967)-C(5))-methyltransferase RsmB [Oceanobacillus halotolerans]|uniref:16S rRNA (cytosine(967)-C(5))-methyltransferase RsmB n=1 Tax=Oceanobacillus halotolerans TaxID=2663380 RepID=UPI0013DC6A98|nr:16S rRNA (cytosine(967)-C(5))-methyltransferase RsmB [Oceanobacillus halotolerans]